MTTGRRIITWFMTAHWGSAALFVIIHSVRIEKGKKNSTRMKERRFRRESKLLVWALYLLQCVCYLEGLGT